MNCWTILLVANQVGLNLKNLEMSASAGKYQSDDVKVNLSVSAEKSDVQQNFFPNEISDISIENENNSENS